MLPSPSCTDEAVVVRLGVVVTGVVARCDGGRGSASSTAPIASSTTGAGGRAAGTGSGSGCSSSASVGGGVILGSVEAASNGLDSEGRSSAAVAFASSAVFCQPLQVR